jgi:hypothetical protein
MSRLRAPFLFIGLFLFLVVVLMDVGGSPAILAIVGESGQTPPGLGMRALVLLDVLLFSQVIFLGADALGIGRVARWLNGPGNLILCIVVIFGGIALALAALGLVILMISVLMALPFGPLIYAAIWGSFARGTAMGLLSSTLTLRLIAGVLLVVYDQSVLGKKRLLLLFFTCLVGDLVVSFLLGLVPGLLCSITDAVGAIIGGILGIIWAIILLIPAISGTLRLIRLRA